MSLNDLYRLIIMEDQSIASDGHSFRAMLDDVFLGNLTGRDYLTANIGSGEHRLTLRNGNITVCERIFVVAEGQNITRGFVKKAVDGRTVIAFDGGAEDRPVEQSDVTRPKAPPGQPKPPRQPKRNEAQLRRKQEAEEERARQAAALRRRGCLMDALIAFLGFCAGVVATWLFFRF